MKIPVIALQYESMAEQQYAMQMIAKILGTEAEGAAVYRILSTDRGRGSERVAAVPENERVRIYHSTAEAYPTDNAQYPGRKIGLKPPGLSTCR